MSERDYIRGQKGVYRELLSVALKGLGSSGDKHRWAAERADTVAMLRMICEQFGDNDWEDSLHLADVIEKHLGRHLHGRTRKPISE